jgi:hypothetical protein
VAPRSKPSLGPEPLIAALQRERSQTRNNRDQRDYGGVWRWLRARPFGRLRRWLCYSLLMRVNVWASSSTAGRQVQLCGTSTVILGPALRRASCGRRSARGLRPIGLDRPGLGLSDYQSRRRLSDWSDVVQVLIAWGCSGSRSSATPPAGRMPWTAVTACRDESQRVPLSPVSAR